jgi:hypothetical protein
MNMEVVDMEVVEMAFGIQAAIIPSALAVNRAENLKMILCGELNASLDQSRISPNASPVCDKLYLSASNITVVDQ